MYHLWRIHFVTDRQSDIVLTVLGGLTYMLTDLTYLPVANFL